MRTSPHTLRHTLGRNWIMKGGDAVSLQIIQGHSSLEMTQDYANLSQNELIDKNKKFNPLISICDESITPNDQSISPIDKSLLQ
jgi:site-specific recombinase XerD